MYSVQSDQVKQKQLPGRSVRVLTEVLPVHNMTFGLCEVPPRSTMSAHSHSQEEIIFVLQGHGHVSVAGIEEPVLPGTLVQFPSGVEHFTANESDEILRFAFCFSPPVVVGSYDKA